MNDTQGYDYLVDFYGPSSHWFAIFIWITSVIIILSNTFFIMITLTSSTLSSKSSNWLLVGFALSDLVHGSIHLYDAYAIWFGSIDNRGLCELAGIFVVYAAPTSWGFPGLVAANRYYRIKITEYGEFSLGKILFSDRYIIPVMIAWCCFSSVGSTALVLLNTTGEDPGGFCGARKFTDIRMLLLYEQTMVIFFMSLILSAVYYWRLATWLKQNRESTSQDTKELTREIMTFTKIITLIPVVLAGPGTMLSTFQMVEPEMPMWVKRTLTAPYWLSSVANPWLTMALVRPFRSRLLEILRKAKIIGSEPLSGVVIVVTSK